MIIPSCLNILFFFRFAATNHVSQHFPIQVKSATVFESRKPFDPDLTSILSRMSNSASSSALVANTKTFVKDYMKKINDSSHDYIHVERVMNLAHKLLKAEQEIHPEVSYSSTVVTLAALMHDVGDHKHRDLGKECSADDPACIVSSTLMSFGATSELAYYVQKVVRNVSYLYEPLDPVHIENVLRTHPELAIVQDADRLDSLGAIGIGRKFTRFGVKGGQGNLGDVIKEFEKLRQLEGTIKTSEGRTIARARIERCRIFATWWANEQDVDEPEVKVRLSLLEVIGARVHVIKRFLMN